MRSECQRSFRVLDLPGGGWHDINLNIYEFAWNIWIWNLQFWIVKHQQTSSHINVRAASSNTGLCKPTFFASIRAMSSWARNHFETRICCPFRNNLTGVTADKDIIGLFWHTIEILSTEESNAAVVPFCGVSCHHAEKSTEKHVIKTVLL